MGWTPSMQRESFPSGSVFLKIHAILMRTQVAQGTHCLKNNPDTTAS